MTLRSVLTTSAGLYLPAASFVRWVFEKWFQVFIKRRRRRGRRPRWRCRRVGRADRLSTGSYALRQRTLHQRLGPCGSYQIQLLLSRKGVSCWTRWGPCGAVGRHGRNAAGGAVGASTGLTLAIGLATMLDARMATREDSMDITFACESCGQNLVIDEAGAGLTIQCPKCGTSLEVPCHTKTLDKDGAAYLPRLLLEGNGTSYFRPRAVSTTKAVGS